MKSLIIKNEEEIDFNNDFAFIINELDCKKGMYLSSGTEYPGRYSRWDIGFTNPPVELTAKDNIVSLNALNPKGIVILRIIEAQLKEKKHYQIKEQNETSIQFEIISDKKSFAEENRSKNPSVFSVIRDILNLFKTQDDDFAGFYGAFGYDLLFQFEPIILKHKRDAEEKLLHLYLPDKIYVSDRRKEKAFILNYDFKDENSDTTNCSTEAFEVKNPIFSDSGKYEILSDMPDEEYANLVRKSKEKMLAGDIFELVLHREFYSEYKGRPSFLFEKMLDINPSPYQFFCQLGDMQLIGASPEMFIRVNGKRVESCPISGTIKRGTDAIEDSKKIKELINSEKDEVELTMCTDVDRNDKSRICVPGSINILGRRQIEKYKGLFHTVDHIEGTLREDIDAIDAFLSHMWAVTLMGAPKTNASELIESYEKGPRGYYGGAIGALLFNGNINTGITIRTVHLKDGTAKYPVGSSLVYDSIPEEEAMETRTKSTSFFNLLSNKKEVGSTAPKEQVGQGLKVVVIDNKDSFVNTLSDYFRQTGAQVKTYRSPVAISDILKEKPDLVLHSPGPGRPKDYKVPETILELSKYPQIYQFGVCLGLQGMVEAFGGELTVMPIPRHGKQWEIEHNGQGLFENIPSPTSVGAYHSLCAVPEKMPECLEVIAHTQNLGVIMAIKHKTLPLSAVQFHPESIMSLEKGIGFKIIENVVRGILKKC